MEPLITNRADLLRVKQRKEDSFYKVKGDSPETTTTDVDMSKRIVKGISNTFYFFDSDQDVLVKGATAKSIKDRGPKSQAAAKIKNVKDHVISRRIGVAQELSEETVDGKTVQLFETKMMTNTDGNDTLIEYQEGGIDNHSIGFQYMEMELVTADDEEWKTWLNQLINPKDAEKFGYMFVIKEINQFEFSPVSFGANSLTPYLGVKAGNKEGLAIKVLERIDWLENAFKNGRQTDDCLKNYQLESLQLKELISEIFNQPASLKDTLWERRPKTEKSKEESTPNDNPEPFDLDAAIKSTQFIKI